MSGHNGVTFCVFAHFLDPYIRRGILPYVANAVIEPFLAIQAKPDEESPDVRMNHIIESAQQGRHLIFGLDASTPLAMSAIQYCHCQAIRCGLIVKIADRLPALSALHAQAPVAFVLGVGHADLSQLFPKAQTWRDTSNGLCASIDAKNFILKQLGAFAQ